MHTTAQNPRWRAREMAGTLGVYLATTLLSAWLGRQRPLTQEAALLSAAAAAAGTLAVALLLVRRVAYPRWSFLAAAGILATTAVLGPLLVHEPAAWAAGMRPTLWMHPWMLMTFAWTAGRAGVGVCSPAAPRAGWFLLGATMLFAAITSVPGFVA